MKAAVYDTYVRKADNSGTYHFDIIVEKEKYSDAEVINFGKEHLKNSNADFQDFSVDECQFCHIETPSEEMIEAIKSKGYYILLLDDIPGELPENATRSQMIQYLRAFNKELRFSDFSKLSFENIVELVNHKL